MFRFCEGIEHALGTQKQRDNAAHLVGLIEGLDVAQLDPEHEVAQLADALVGFCSRQAVGDSQQSQDEHSMATHPVEGT